VKSRIDERIEIIATGLVDPDVIPVLLKGNHLRGGLLMLVYESISGKDNCHEALDLASAIEIAHSANLIMDNMIDEDDIRSGLPTIQLTPGHKKAMLETIGTLSLPYSLAARTGSPYVSMLADTQRSMASGAIKELFRDPDLPASKLYDIRITHKTGQLFSLAAKWGCMAAFGSQAQQSTGTIGFGNYGMHCGKALQVAADITDLYETLDGIKKRGSDSDILLLNCVGMDGLVKEFVHDLRDRAVDFHKFNKLRNLKAAVHDTLVGMCDTEIERSTSCIDEISDWYKINPENKERLITAPHDIIRIVTGEDITRRPDGKK